MAASTFGTGLLIRAAIDAGADRIVLGLGGSATTDGGTGLAHAFGFRFLDAHDSDIPLGGGALVDLARIDDSRVSDSIKNVPIVLACDVTNPLTGPEGAAHVFAPQKGATATQSSFSIRGLRISRAQSCNITAAISSTLRERALREVPEVACLACSTQQ